MSFNNRVAGMLISSWDKYWLKPSPVFNLGVCRIIIVGYQVLHLLLFSYHNKITDIAHLPNLEYEPLPIFLALNFPFFGNNIPPEWFLSGMFWVAGFSGLCALIGYRTNITLLVFAISNIYMRTYVYSFGRFHHPEAIMLIALLALALSPAGRSLSFDDLGRRSSRNLRQQRFNPFNVLLQSSSFAGWALLLVQWMFAIAYFSAAVNKLTPDGAFSLDWVNGYTLRYYLVSDGLTWNSALGVWLGQFHLLAIAFSWFAVLFEGTFFLTLVFPRLIWIYVPLGMMFHLGIYAAQRAPFFQYLPLYAVFLPWTAIVKAISNRLNRAHNGQKAEIFYDGACPLCIRSMTVLCYFDWFQRLTYSDLEVRWPSLAAKHPDISFEDCLAEMHFLKPDDSVLKGFFAFREIVSYIPVFWPLRPLMYLPGMDIIGPRVYRLIASRRTRLERCTFDQCSL